MICFISITIGLPAFTFPINCLPAVTMSLTENISGPQSETQAECQVAPVAVKPPPFWKGDPALWFARLEAQFELARITTDSTKFNHVLSAIESDILHSVSDLVLRPPAENKYEALKKRLIEIHSESEASKMRTLLQGPELGDQRPSQLLSHMRSLAGGNVGEPLLKSLWLARLPTSTQGILAAFSEDLDKLATAADQIRDLTSPSLIGSVSTTPREDRTSQLESKVDQLSQQVSKLTTLLERSRSPGRSPGYSRDRSGSRSRFKTYLEPKDGYCFYHTNFGRKANKCNPPCSFQSEN